MAVATDSTTAPARRLLRAAGPCRVLTTDEMIASLPPRPGLARPAALRRAARPRKERVHARL